MINVSSISTITIIYGTSVRWLAEFLFQTSIMDREENIKGRAGPKIGCMNCNGLGDKTKRNKVLTWLKGKPENIIFLQETHSTVELEDEWKKEWEGDIHFSHGASNSTGVAILIKNKENITIDKARDICQGRVLLIEVTYNSVKYCLVNNYSPNKDDHEFIENLFLEALGRGREDHLIMAGDWNAVLNNDLDKLGGATCHANKYYQSYINTMINDYGLTDIYRRSWGEKRKYTHFNKTSKTASRLDFFLIEDNLCDWPVCKTDISHGYNSDHSYISLNLQGSTIERGKGYWKLNNSHLQEGNFVDDVKAIINDTKNSSFDSYVGLWDVIKFKIKDYAIRFGKIKKKNNMEEKNNLLKDIEKVKNSPEFMRDESLRNELFEAEAKLNKILDNETSGIITRARAKWTEQGERSNKYFFSLEKSNSKKKNICKLINESKVELYEQDEISKHVVDFYRNLFRAKDNNINNMKEYINSCEAKILDARMTEALDEEFSLSEIDSVYKSLKNNKSPGWDGLTAEFYKIFWEDIKDILFNCYKEAIETGSLSPSQRIGILTLIPKPKNVAFIKNWRPITLLNVDYKIFTHVIKNRLLRSLPHIISNVQSGFQAGRSTSDNLILMYLTLEHYYNNPQEECLLLQLDLEKAFGSVEHAFMYETLKFFGFGENLIRLVKVAFHGCMSYANVNGHLSDTIYISRGLHQGSPLSPILFLIVAQILTCKLNSNQDVKGIYINSVEILLSLFADDTDIFLHASIECLEAVLSSS